MIPIPPRILTPYLAVYAIVGIAAGLFVGLGSSLISKIGSRSIIADGFLGVFGCLAGFIAAVLIPRPLNTVTYHVNGIVETYTTNRYQHPERIALAVAIALPLIRELYRFSRAQTKPRP